MDHQALEGGFRGGEQLVSAELVPQRFNHVSLQALAQSGFLSGDASGDWQVALGQPLHCTLLRGGSRGEAEGRHWEGL